MDWFWQYLDNLKNASLAEPIEFLAAFAPILALLGAIYLYATGSFGRLWDLFGQRGSAPEYEAREQTNPELEKIDFLLGLVMKERLQKEQERGEKEDALEKSKKNVKKIKELQRINEEQESEIRSLRHEARNEENSDV